MPAGSKFSDTEWQAAPAYAGGSVQTADAGVADTIDQEKAKLQGDPQFTDDIKGLDRERSRLDPSVPPSPNAAKLLALVGGAGAALEEHAASSPNANKLIALVNGGGAGRGSINRTVQDQPETPPPSWMQAARKAMSAVPPARAAFELAQPGVGNAVARRAAPVAAGAPGDMIDFAGNTVPQFIGQNGLGGHTGLPTSEDVSGAMDKAGWQDQRAQHPLASQFGTAVGSVAPVGEVASAVIGPVARKAGRAIADYGKGGQIGRDVDQFGQQVVNTAGMRATKGIEDVRAPDVKPGLAPVRQGAAPAKPVEDWSTEGLPGMRQNGRPAAPQDIDAEFGGAVGGRAKSITSEQQAARARYNEIAPPENIDLTDFKRSLEDRIKRGGPGEQRTAARNLLNDINHVESESDTKFASLEEIKRQLGQKAGFGDAPTGYSAIASTKAGSAYDELASAMKTAHPDYEEWSNLHAQLARDKSASRASFLKSVGEDEQSGSLMKGALKSPENVKLAKEALGENGGKQFDDMASRYVVSQLQGKSAAAIEKWSLENEATLREVPQTAQTVLKMQQRADRVLAEKGLYEHALEAHKTAQAIDTGAFTGAMNAQKAQEVAEARARDAAHSLVPSITAVQVAKTPKEQATAIGSLIDDLYGKKMIDEAQYRTWAEQLSSMQKSASRQAALQTMAKYISYAVTGNYLVSFGGPAAMKYISAASK